jgi:hypothetical protein
MPALTLVDIQLGATRFGSVVQHVKDSDAAAWRDPQFRSAARSVANAEAATDNLRLWVRSRLLATYPQLSEGVKRAEPFHPVHMQPVAEALMMNGATKMPELSVADLRAFGSEIQPLTERGAGKSGLDNVSLSTFI